MFAHYFEALAQQSSAGTKESRENFSRFLVHQTGLKSDTLKIQVWHFIVVSSVRNGYIRDFAVCFCSSVSYAVAKKLVETVMRICMFWLTVTYRLGIILDWCNPWRTVSLWGYRCFRTRPHIFNKRKFIIDVFMNSAKCSEQINRPTAEVASVFLTPG
jgi:hypothetical protein